MNADEDTVTVIEQRRTCDGTRQCDSNTESVADRLEKLRGIDSEWMESLQCYASGVRTYMGFCHIRQAVSHICKKKRGRYI